MGPYNRYRGFAKVPSSLLPQQKGQPETNDCPSKVRSPATSTIQKTSDTKLLELRSPKSIRPVGILALKLLSNHEDVAAYVNALMQVEPADKTTEISGFQHLETLATSNKKPRCNNVSLKN